MRKWKQQMAMLLIVVMLFSLLTACNKESEKTPVPDTTVASIPEPPEPTLTPYVQEQEAALRQEIDRLAAEGEKLVITIGLPTNVLVEDYNSNAYTLWLEEQSGYDLQFVPYQISPHIAYDHGLSADGHELPDILWNFKINRASYEKYGAEGILLDMAPYYQDEVLSGVFWERFTSIPNAQDKQYLLEALTAGDGGMYAFSNIQYSLADTMQYQVYINQTWLDQLNLEMPHDFASLKEVLIAFRDGDPNGNGKKDDLPLIGSANATSGNIVMWLVNMFTYVNNATYFNVDSNGKLYLPHTTDIYRKALIEIRSLIKEGLMFNSAFSMSNREIESLLNPPEGEYITVGVFAGDPDLVWIEGDPAMYNYVPMPYWGYCNRNYNAFTPATFITKDCDYPLAAWKLFMLMCSEEGTLRACYGEKGVDWDDAAPNTQSYLGKPARIKVLRAGVAETKGNSVWGTFQGNIMVQNGAEICQLTDDMGQWINRKMENMAQCYNYYIEGENDNRPEKREGVYPLPRLDVPPGVSKSDVNERNNSVYVILDALYAFCCGSTQGSFNQPGTMVDVTNDDHWNAYLAALEAQGYKVWMENRQRMLDEQYPDYVKKFEHEEVIP